MGKQQDVFWESNPTNIKSTAMTERYAHLAPEHLSEEMNRVEKWLQEGTTLTTLPPAVPLGPHPPVGGLGHTRGWNFYGTCLLVRGHSLTDHSD